MHFSLAFLLASPFVGPAQAAHATVIQGRVLAAEGWPASGAIVTSRWGGRTVAGADGSFSLEVELPPGTERVCLDARLVDEPDCGGSTEAFVAHPGGLNTVGVIELGFACQPQWKAEFGGYPGMNDTVRALVTFDDGSGPALIAGGTFSRSGDVRADRIARWDGGAWSSLGSGLGNANEVNALAAVGAGESGGPALYAAGFFKRSLEAVANSIACWDGRRWSALGTGVDGTILALALAHEGGRGPSVYAGGIFALAGGAPAANVAKWDGREWSALGSGLDGTVRALALFDDGHGPALFAGGSFTSAGGTALAHIARWDGREWSDVGGGVSGVTGIPEIAAMAAFDDGSGPALYVAGKFTAAGGVPVVGLARWDGQAWTAVGAQAGSDINSLAVLDDGNGPALHASGRLSAAALSGISRWNGTRWTIVAPRVFQVLAMAYFDDGRGAAPSLYVGGHFDRADQAIVQHIARWDGASWSALHSKSVDDRVWALATFDDGARGGEALYVGGEFTSAGGLGRAHVAKWDGRSWSGLGSGVDGDVLALAPARIGGARARLFAGGRFLNAGGKPAARIAAWDGAQWSALGSGAGGEVLALAEFDDGTGPALYAGGTFRRIGGVMTGCIAKWDGTAWAPLAGGVASSAFQPAVRSLCVFDDGRGPALYVGGDFREAGGNRAHQIARWDGSSWSPLGEGLDEFTSERGVYALTVYDDRLGGGPALYAGGDFRIAAIPGAIRIARWNGTSWSALGTGMNDRVYALRPFSGSDAGKEHLYVAGDFAIAGNVNSGSIARWDGMSWSTVRWSSGQIVAALTVLGPRQGRGAALFAGGIIEVSPGTGDAYLACYQGCPDTTPPTLFCPDPIVVVDEGSPGERVSFRATVFDDFDELPSLEFAPRSGSTFPTGLTRVACKATDDSGNQSSCEFTVLVAPSKAR